MKSLFQEVLKDNADPRSRIEDEKSAILDWMLSEQKFSEDAYQRNVICKNGELNEVVLACWRQGQITPFHHHPGQSCWIYMLKGTLEETLVETSSHSKKQFKEPIKENLKNWAALEMEYKGSLFWEEISKTKRITNISAGQWNYIDDKKGFHRMYAVSDEVVSLHFYRELS